MDDVSKEFGDITKQLEYKGQTFTVTVVAAKSFFEYNKSRLAYMNIECNGISTIPQSLITPELWQDEPLLKIIVYDFAKFLF